MDSNLSLGLKYYYGIDEYQSYQKAYELLLGCSEAGDCVAKYHVGTMLYYGYGVRKDKVKAIALITDSSNYGYHHAEYFVGSRHEDGRDGFAKDKKLAYEYYEKSAIKGNIYGCITMGDHYYYESKNNPDCLNLAIQYYRIGVDNGSSDCCIRLGDLHILGIGVQKDKTLAKQYYEKAIESNHSVASEVARQRIKAISRLHRILEDDR